MSQSDLLSSASQCDHLRQARERAEGGAVLTAAMEERVGAGWRALANVAAREAGSLGSQEQV